MKFVEGGRERYIGEGGSKARQERQLTKEASIAFAVSASPMLTSLVTFLFRDKKVTPFGVC